MPWAALNRPQGLRATNAHVAIPAGVNTMKHLLVSLATAAILLGAAMLLGTAATSQGTTAPVKFGMDAASVAAQASAGAKADYGTFWIGPWTLKSGWGGPDGQLTSMKSAGVTPAVHFYYWGDDISISCVENGCWSDLHDAQKTRAGWQQLGQQLTDHLTAKMGGAPVVVFLESEFNKGGISEYEPFDGYMAEMTKGIKARYPAAQVVLGFGNWGSDRWGNFDRAAAASDMVGIQGMRGSTHGTLDSYYALYDASLAGAKRLKSLFNKPIMLTDIALSSYPEPEYLTHQQKSLGEFFTGMAALKETGVTAMIYRSWRDSPGMDLANYYGEAERHWGLAYASSAGAGQKPAAKVWIDGVKAERSGATPTPAPTPPPASLAVPVAGAAFESQVFATKTAGGSVGDAAASGGSTWNLWSNGHLQQAFNLTGAEYQLSVRARGTPLGGVGPRMVVSLGSTQVLDVTPATTYADFGAKVQGAAIRDLRIAFTNDAASASEDRNLLVDRVLFTPVNRAPVPSFTATVGGLRVDVDASASSDPDGDALRLTWTFGDGATAQGTLASHTYAAGGDYVVALTAHDGVTGATARKTVTLVAPNSPPEARFTTTSDGLTLRLDASGSTDADGDGLTMAWNFGDGATAQGVQSAHTYARSGTYNVVLTVSDGASSSTTQKTISVAVAALAASFKPAANVNEWWVDVLVTANNPIAGVTVSVNGAAPVALSKSSWGTWAKSTHAPRGSTVVFRATDAYGQTVTSPAFTWLGSAFTAQFSPRSQSNPWWIETAVTANQAVAKVEARLDGGAWIQLPATSWGTYAKSLHAEKGTKVEFRATSTTGATAQSGAFVWG